MFIAKRGSVFATPPAAIARGRCRQGSTLAVFRYPEHPRFSDGIPDSPARVIFFGVRKMLGTILGRFSIIYFRGLGLRIKVMVWVMVRARVMVWVRVGFGVGVRVSVVLWSW